MTFSYTPAAATDTTRVRFHLRDTDEASAIFSDEEISFAITEETTWQAAVILLIETIIAKLSHEPDMTADWLTISWRRSTEAWQMLLAEKRARFGIAARTGRAKATYRSDSLQTEAPDW